MQLASSNTFYSTATLPAVQKSHHRHGTIEGMKIINQTADEMTLTHPSLARGILGALFTLVGGGLFISSALMQGDTPLFALASFASFCAGLIILFVNADITITLHKPSGTVHHHERAFGGPANATYALRDATAVEIVPRKEHRPAEVFIVFNNGSRVRIDYAHRLENVSKSSIAARVAEFLAVPLITREI